MTIRIKRIYDTADRADGFRVLVDRLWPRGVSKERASIDLWLKEVAPSTPLRTWFHHEPQLWDEFRARYVSELKDNVSVAELTAITTANRIVTLLYSARDEQRNQAVVLQEYLNSLDDSGT